MANDEAGEAYMKQLRDALRDEHTKVKQLEQQLEFERSQLESYKKHINAVTEATDWMRTDPTLNIRLGTTVVIEGVAALKRQRDTYRAALEEIRYPIAAMRARLKEDETLNGMMAVRLAESASYLQEIAATALGKTVVFTCEQCGEPITGPQGSISTPTGWIHSGTHSTCKPEVKP